MRQKVKVVATKPVQSIYELADSLGVSASTVSRVLNQRRGIGKATRQRVLASARAAGFRPRMTARQRTVAVVIDHHQFSSYGSFVPNVLTSMVDALSKHDLAVELVTAHNYERLTNRLMDGVLAMAWNDDTIKILKRVKDAPVVTLNRMDVPGFSAVVSDHFQHGQMAVEYLAGHGHKRIAMIGREGENWGAIQRIEGFTSKLHELGLAVDSSSVCFTKHQPMYGVLHRLIRQSKPTAILWRTKALGLKPPISCKIC